MLSTAGGLDADGEWREPSHKGLLSTDLPRTMIKAKLRDGFTKLLSRGRLRPWRRHGAERSAGKPGAFGRNRPRSA